MLDAATRAQIKATARVLQTHGEALTRHFYARMFTHNPELREVFNQGHQRSGTQQQALAMAVGAYATHIDAPEALTPALRHIASKHVSLGVREEHYAIVGRHLLASIGEVMGEAATPALLQAWAAAYDQLARLLIGMEQALYNDAASRPGGWTGWRTFRVRHKQPEGSEITSFKLVPADGGPVPAYRAGQFVSVRAVVPELGYRQPRQYSLSAAPGQDHLRISVKREQAGPTCPAGMVSQHLHDRLHAGDCLEVSPPAGDFYLDESSSSPVVLISAGVGITPMMAMLAQLQATAPHRVVRFLHAARHAGVQAFADEVRRRTGALRDAKAWFVHEQAAPQAGLPVPDAYGRLNLEALPGADWLPHDADCHVCGPAAFMVEQMGALRARGIPAERIHAEAFGTGGVATA